VLPAFSCGIIDNMQSMIEKIKRKIWNSRKFRRFGSDSFPTEKEREALSQDSFEFKPKFSILTPLYNTPEEFLYEMIMSVMGQTYGNFELCLADGSDSSHSYVGRICRALAEKDGRIIYKKLEKNEGISGNTNECVKMATGDYIGLLDHDDVLHPCALFEYAKAINERGGDFLYSDEVTFGRGDVNHIQTVFFKPDFAIDNLRANNYICHFTCFKGSLLSGMELFRKEYDGSQDHDMVLRLVAKAESIIHVPKVLYYWRAAAGSTAKDISAKEYAVDAGVRAVSDHLKEGGFEGFEVTSVGAVPTIYRVDYKVEASSEDFLTLMDEGCRPVTLDWQEKLLMYAQREDVGAVGALIRNTDGSVKSAGLVLGMGSAGTVGHLFAGTAKDQIGYLGQLLFARNVSAISGLCMMVSKSKFEEVGGFDERFTGDLKFADLCLKLRAKGYLNVWTPFAEIVYNNSDGDIPGPALDEEAAAFMEKWGEVLASGDPYYNPNLSLDYQDCRIKE